MEGGANGGGGGVINVGAFLVGLFRSVERFNSFSAILLDNTSGGRGRSKSGGGGGGSRTAAAAAATAAGSMRKRMEDGEDEEDGEDGEDGEAGEAGEAGERGEIGEGKEMGEGEGGERGERDDFTNKSVDGDCTISGIGSHFESKSTTTASSEGGTNPEPKAVGASAAGISVVVSAACKASIVAFITAAYVSMSMKSATTGSSSNNGC